MCTAIIILGVPFAIGVVVGRFMGKFQWEYRIARSAGNSYFTIHSKPTFWPFWHDTFSYSSTIEETKKKIELLKKGGEIIE